MITLNYLEIEAHQRIEERLRTAEQHRLLKTVIHSHQTSLVWPRAIRWVRSSLSLTAIIYLMKEAVNER